MDQEYKEFFMKRCQKSLIENEEYKELEENEETSQDLLQAKAEFICFRKGYAAAIKDILAILMV